jgi:hypothetical protein
MKTIVNIILLSIVFTSLFAQDKGFKFSDRLTEKQIDLFFNGKLLTSYYYVDSIKKPVLFPVNTVSGITVTRGFPIAPRAGERMDHPHQVGLWMSYESVNGIDFWNHSTFTPYQNRSSYGTILHDGIVKTQAGENTAVLEVTARWLNSTGQILLRESTQYEFVVKDNNFIINRTTTLNTLEEDVFFKDVKDGLLAIRVARELEHPSIEPGYFVDSLGNSHTESIISNDSLSGEYLSSEGLTGNAVWGTKARWVTLRGKKDSKNISITLVDHPKNIGYPAYWHTRDYGLFAINPLGQEIFSKGQTKLNLLIHKGESLTLRYRVIIHEGDPLDESEINALSDDFIKP